MGIPTIPALDYTKPVDKAQEWLLQLIVGHVVLASKAGYHVDAAHLRRHLATYTAWVLETDAARAADVAAGGRECCRCRCTDNGPCLEGCGWGCEGPVQRVRMTDGDRLDEQIRELSVAWPTVPAGLWSDVLGRMRKLLSPSGKHPKVPEEVRYFEEIVESDGEERWTYSVIPWGCAGEEILVVAVSASDAIGLARDEYERRTEGQADPFYVVKLERRDYLGQFPDPEPTS